ncbi:MAG: IPT/TIG domain-containing protein [Steroidobacter sp.]
MHVLRISRVAVAASVLLIVAGCGGGGGGSPPPNPPSPPPGSSQPPDNSAPPDTTPQPDPDPLPDTPPPATVSGTVSYETTNLTFSTVLRNSTPPEQRVAFTIDGAPTGTLYASVQGTGRTLFNANVQFTDGGGYVRFVPNTAARLDAGINTGTVTITVCLDDSFCRSKVIGQPQTFNVTYNVTAAVQGTTVTPRVVAANNAGTVILRGKGFADASSVRFGTTAASNVTVVSDTEIRATYPSLTPGRYAVSIDGGAVSFTGSLVTVNVPTYAATLTPFTTAPFLVSAAVHDAERNNLYVVTQAEQSENSQLVRFGYTGATWSVLASNTIPDLQDVAFSPDGGVLIAATSSRLIELDPATFDERASYAFPDQASIQSIALANDGYLVVTTGDYDNFGASPIYLYSTLDHSFARSEATARFALTGGNASGSFVGLVESTDEGTTAGIPQYDASAQLFSGLSNMPENLNSIGVPFLRPARPALDFSGSVLVLSTNRLSSGFGFDNSTIAFRADTRQRIGQLPAYAHGTFVNDDASRAYTVRSQLGIGSDPLELRTYDLSQFTEIGTGISLGVSPGDASIQIATPPNRAALFIVGAFGVKVQPLPN